MKSATTFLCSVLCFSLHSFSYAKTVETIPVIGTDDQGNSEVIEVPKAEYVSRFNLSATTVNDSLIEAFNAASSLNQATLWHLRTVGIGLGSTVEVGIGKFKIGATPRTRLLFTNSTTPSLP
ncbi:MAG: hypothetical protein ACXVLQ_14725 [Bacteriovorax sp.]